MIKIDIPPYGYVELLDYMGDDLTVVNAARISYGRNTNVMRDKDIALLDQMMNGRHGSPFESCVIQLRVCAPLFVRSQWERHRMASYSETSGRRHTFEPEFYSYGDEDYEAMFREIYDLYLSKIGAGMPKEQARVILPEGIYTTFWVTANLRSWMNFISLRKASDAQDAIQEYGKAVETIFVSLYPMIWASFNTNGRVAP